MQCASCAVQLPAGSRFCLSCGQAVGVVSQVSTAMAADVGAVAAGVGRLVSSDSIPVGGLTPGTVLATRYRIIGLLGRGGMGEVYRADDLKLGQPVALKFLPAALSSDPVRRERFFAEVRITRQLAHPNICRVYDIAEVNGQHFLSMEFIDGEDLASLLKRIGYLPNEKALDITRQLLAGLAAAHERGVLHRDLKPSNIMIDGHGRVRITDFGLAVATTDEEQPVGDVSGTPAYMAPEQLAGKGASVRSDVYALGLVLYEIVSGKRAFTSLTIAALREEKEQSTPTAPSELRGGIDPIVERLVMRCLERDPRQRPASVAQLAAALPGGDPLAAAIAAGETPSPELVAASGLKEGLRPSIATGILALVVVLMTAAVALKPRVDLYRQIPFDKPPAALVEQSRQILKKMGYGSPTDDSAWGFTTDPAYISWLESTDKSPERWRRNGGSAVQFWYRQSPGSLMPTALLQNQATTVVDPPMETPGEIALALDTAGHLKWLIAVPPQTETIAGGSAPDWSTPFAEAGLDFAQWTRAEPERDPLFHADTLMAWKGSTSGYPGVPLRVEAAARRGKVSSFLVTGPWAQPTRLPSATLSVGIQILQLSTAVLVLAMLVGVAFFARRNLRLGRGDRKGAMRIAVVSAVLVLVTWLVSAHHVVGIGEVALFGGVLAVGLLTSAMFWLFYIALEPVVRRQLPHTLVSWTRVLSGDWRDPGVGKDLLAGLVFGLLMYFVISLDALVPSWFGSSGSLIVVVPDGLLGAGDFISSAIGRLLTAAIPLSIFFLIFLVRVHRFVGGALALLLVGAFTLTETQGLILGVLGAPGLVGAAVFLICIAMTALVLIRFGLFAGIVGFFVEALVRHFPITFHASAWYASTGYAALILVAAIACYGFKTSLGGQPLLAGVSLDDA